MGVEIGKGWGPGEGLGQIMTTEVERLNLDLLDTNSNVDIK